MINNEVLNTINNRKSIRAFSNKPVEEGLIAKIIEAGQRAPSTGNAQAYSVVSLENTEKRKIIGEAMQLQKFVYSAPVWLFVCADWNRQGYLYRKHNIDFTMTKSNKLFIGVLEASLFTQNMVIAAEALGLGSILIGSVWCDMESVVSTLKLPEDVFPVMILCLGYYKIPPQLTPRWDLENVYHKEEYVKTTEDSAYEYFKSTNKRLIHMKYFDEGITNLKDHLSMRVGEVGNKRTWSPLDKYIKKYLND